MELLGKLQGGDPVQRYVLLTVESAVVYKGVSDPATLEALACNEALALAEDLQLSKVCVAWDAATVVQEINEGSRGCYSSIICDTEARKNKFSQIMFRALGCLFCTLYFE
jgi:hypothetical protein